MALPATNNYMKQPQGNLTVFRQKRNTQDQGKTHKPSPLFEFLYSTSGAVVARTVLSPVQRIQFILQTQHELLRTRQLNRTFAGFNKCLDRVYKREGLVGLWRGNILGCVYTTATCVYKTFAANGIVHELNEVFDSERIARKQKVILSCSIADCVFNLLSYPVLYGQIRLAADLRKKDGSYRFRGIADVYRKTLSEGIRGVYRGLPVACYGTLVYYIVCFYGLELSKYLEIITFSNAQEFESIFYFSPIVTLGRIFQYPLNTLSHRMMVTSCTQYKYKHFPQALFRMVRTEEFFRNLMAGFLVNFACGIATVAVFSWYMKDLRKIHKYWSKL